jgi:hypothetical protein
VAQEHAGGVLVRGEHPHRLAGLHQQGLVGLQVLQGAQDGVEALPVAGRLARSAVDDEVVGVAGHVGIEVVLQHTVRRFDEPVLAV